MADIDLEQDLAQVTTQLEQVVAQANDLSKQRETLMEQLHNLNGIAMYLRGKQQAIVSESPNGVVEDLERSEEYPKEILAS